MAGDQEDTVSTSTIAISEGFSIKLEDISIPSKSPCPACGSKLDSANSGEEIPDATVETGEKGVARTGSPQPEKFELQTTHSPKDLTRIGRISRNDEGKISIVDEAEWEAPPDPGRDGTFAITLQKEIKGHNAWGKAIEGKDEITIVSPLLQDIFRSVIKYYPGIGLDGSNITFKDPYAPLFFYYDQLRSRAEEDPKEKTKEDFTTLERFYVNWVIQEHKKIRKIIDQGIIQYNYLWALFSPGDLIWGLDDMSQPCVYMLVGTGFRKPEVHYVANGDFSSRRFHRLCADVWHVTWDEASRKFQRITTTRTIRSFSGGRSITSLPFYPLKYYKNGDQEEIDKFLSMLEERGRSWRTLVSEPPACKSYSGSAMERTTCESEPLEDRVVVDGISVFNKPKGDQSTYGFLGGFGVYRYQDRELPMVSDGLNPEYIHFDNFSPREEFTSLQAQLCPSSVSCCALKSRKWYNISVSKIGEVNWAKEALDHLVLDQKTKSMLLGLVQRHRKNKDEILSDVIPSKGKGLVIVLHGPPGVGKTLTAETIAEYTQKPLYPLNVGELTAQKDVVEHLQKAFNRASSWDAVLLLDEADVLLEKRSYENLVRNGIVSVFLRMLEYYEGILFLTTNRVETMDMAFQSRIHIAIKYNPLTPAVRRQIWENFINRLDKREAEGKEELIDHLDDIQEWELNGRQIRNILSIAESMALSQEHRRGALRYRHVEDVTNETINFDKFFEEAHKERKGQIGVINGRQFQEKRLRSLR